MQYKIDTMNLRDGTLVLEGWGFGKDLKELEYLLTDRKGNPLKCTVVARDRADVATLYGCGRMCGFTAAAPFGREDEAWFVLQDGAAKRRVRITYPIIEKKNSIKMRRAEKLLALVHFETLRVSFDFIRENGLRAFVKKALHKLRKIDEDYDYPEWQLKTKLSEEQLESQREGWKQFPFPGGSAPLISIVIPAYNTAPEYLRMLYDSLAEQTYPVFEVITADGSDEGHTDVRTVTESYGKKDSRFHYLPLGGNRGISGNTNAGLFAASGGYIALCDHDDELPAEALYFVAEAISRNPEAEFIYTDEDKIDFDGRALFEPHLKPDYNPDLLCSVNYICHLSVIRKDLLERTGGFRGEYDGAQDHDFFLRALELAAEDEKKAGLSEASLQKRREGRFTSERIIHVPHVCYHWRYHKGSTASDPKAKLYAFEAGSRAVMDHYARTGMAHVQTVEKGVTYGYYHTVFEKGEEPLVSVIIPNKDHREDLDKCIRSIEEHSDYRNLEFIVAENNSTDPETFAYYKELEARCGLPVKVVTWEREFNYSAINNFAAAFASGEYLLFLNNDVELRSAASITEMMAYIQREDTGAVGARLTYGDDTIQHAGVIVGLGGIAGAAFTGLHEKENSYMHRMMCVQDLSAVTAACLMTKRSVFEAAGGFGEELAVAFNDIDYCMKVRAMGLLVVYNPYVTFYHYESKSRGLEDTPEKVRRFNGEIAVFASKWEGILKNLDPYYNPGLTLRKSNFALRDLSKEKPGEPYRLELNVEEQLKTVLREKQRREMKGTG